MNYIDLLFFILGFISYYIINISFKEYFENEIIYGINSNEFLKHKINSDYYVKNNDIIQDIVRRNGFLEKNIILKNKKINNIFNKKYKDINSDIMIFNIEKSRLKYY